MAKKTVKKTSMPTKAMPGKAPGGHVMGPMMTDVTFTPKKKKK